MICLGGPVKYVVKDDVSSFITDAWLFEKVVPNITCRFPRDRPLCRILGLALLYICLGENEEVFVPPLLRAQVRQNYVALGLKGYMPVEKIPLHVYCSDRSSLMME